MAKAKKKSYEIKGTVPTEDVPKWARRSPKWDELREAVMQLEPGGESLEVWFETPAEANRARNTLRDIINLREQRAVLRTRLVKDEEGDGDGATVFFTRLREDQIVEAE